MKEAYRSELDQVCLTAAGKEALVRRLCRGEETPRRPTRRPWRTFRTAVLAAVALCALIMGVGAAVVHLPVLQGYYGGGAGYEQSAVAVGESVTKSGWTLTLTDFVADDYNLYAGFTLAAPEGTVLDQGAYGFARWGVPKFPGLDLAGASHIEFLEDSDPSDNVLHFVQWSTYTMEEGQRISGQSVELTLGGLYHLTNWNEERLSWERAYDCEETWTFCTTIAVPGRVIRQVPGLPVHTLEVDAVITKLEVSPIGVYVYIEGDALKGHHDWVPRNAPDGWYGCIEYQEITLYTTDGTAIPMMDGMNGSGCSGGTDTSEPGYLHIARRADRLLDLDDLDRIEICGVEIPMR